MNYRPEIDGLRAFAVVAVILYHADRVAFAGGYLGVDVFFVISGFLITQVIAGDLKKGQFSFVGFYERRARRILPALFLVLAASIPFANLLMLPSQKADFWQSVLATTFFSSNFLFWMETGYFLAASDTKPLLHTWSLAVEEQFYLLYPILLFGFWRFAKPYFLAALAVFFAASLLASTVLAESAPAANFYLLPTRAWELFAGAICALISWRPARGAGWLAALGLAAVVASPVLIDASTPMPSVYGLPLVLGTQLFLLSASESNLVGRFLAWRPFVGLGLISYSAYLWHLPIFVFARMYSVRPLGPPEMAALAFASLALAFLSYHVVERPFRKRGEAAVFSRRWLAGILSLVAVSFAAFAYLGQLQPDSVPAPRDPAGPLFTDAEIEQKVSINYGLSEDCEGAFTLSANCRTSDTPEVLLWGDSFAMQLAPAIAIGANWRGMIQHTKSVCIPAVGISVITKDYPASWSDGCIAFNDQVIEWLRGQETIKYVVISSPFGLIYNDVYQRDGTIATQDQAAIVRRQLIETARLVKAMNKSLVIVSPTPVTGEDIGQCIVQSVRQKLAQDTCDFSKDEIHRLSRIVFDFLHDLEDEIPVLFLDELICETGICDTMVDGTFIYRDRGHLSIEGSRYLGENKNLFELIRSIANTRS